MANGDKMAEDIIAAMKGLDSGGNFAGNANKRFGDAVLDNICKSLKLSYTWTAQLPQPPNTPDAATSFKAKLSGAGTLTESEDFTAMLAKLAGLIRGLAITPDVKPPESFTFPSLLKFLPAPPDSAVFSGVGMSGKTDHSEAIHDFCRSLVKHLIDGKNLAKLATTPAAGTHTAGVPTYTSTVPGVLSEITWDEPSAAPSGGEGGG